uniref:laccase n=1 Tax=Monilia sp. M5-3 TaxID=645435 RepID=D7F613_9HELO|nr:laccase 2 [Monilia sp. M5-3]
MKVSYLCFASSAFSVLTTIASPLSQKRACQHGPTSRNCWGNYDILTDYYTTWPNTGRTVEYTWRVTNQTMALDGKERIVLAVNGQYPGPAIEANWGDNIVVHVYNDLQHNGTSIHWHGVRHLNNAEADGAVAVVQCPIAPGDHYTYRWKATQYGTSWWHSHFSLQYSEGVHGPIIIHGPASANYDVDLGPIMLTDWWHTPVFKLAEKALTDNLGLPPLPDNGLINGKNTYLGKGTRFETKFTAGKKHRLRIINSGSDVTFRFSIDGHKLKVIAMDWVPIEPYETTNILVSVGQRYDVIVEANAEPGDYWMRAVPQASCLTPNYQGFDIRGIIRYDPNSKEDPKTLPWDIRDACEDEPDSKLIPVVPKAVGSSALTRNFDANLLPLANGELALRWFINSNHYSPLTTEPSLKLGLDANSASMPPSYIAQEVPQKDKFIYFVVQSLLPLAHPFHLHGHDFYLLTRGRGRYLSSGLLQPLRINNPVRRDVVLLPATGYIVIAFKSDNPGTWLMHCHIAFHLHGGLALQVIERKSEWPGIFGDNKAEMDRVCANWAKYDPLKGKME